MKWKIDRRRRLIGTVIRLKRMGVYFQYINDSKRQMLCIDPTGQHIKRYALGHNIGSRLLHLLLLDDPNEQSGFPQLPFLGTWIGDRIYVGGDDYTPNFASICREYDDIGRNMIELLALNAPVELHQYGGRDWLACLATGDASFRLTDSARKSVLRYLRDVKHHFPSDDVDDLIKLFRPSPDTTPDTQTDG